MCGRVYLCACTYGAAFVRVLVCALACIFVCGRLRTCVCVHALLRAFPYVSPVQVDMADYFCVRVRYCACLDEGVRVSMWTCLCVGQRARVLLLVSVRVLGLINACTCVGVWMGRPLR